MPKIRRRLTGVCGNETGSDMEYNRLYDGFIKLFPDDQEVFDTLSSKNSAYEEDGMHIVFGMIVVPYLQSIVLHEPSKAKKAFDYIEEMEKSGDPMIAEVVEFTILEALIDAEDPNIHRECLKYMGEETKAALNNIGKWFNKE